MRIIALLVFLFPGAHQAGAQGVELGVQFSPWVVRFEDGCSVGRNVIDADKWSFYTFWVKSSAIEVISSGARKTASATLQVEYGREKKLVCIEDYCVTDLDDLKSGLRSSEFAILKLELADGKKAGPFNIPLDGLFAHLFVCGHKDNSPPSPNRPRVLNPEPDVNPQPKR